MAHYTTLPFPAAVLYPVIIMAAATLTMLRAAATPPAPAPAPIGMPKCDTTCGNMTVPYPFGMGPERCYLPGFNLTCDRSSDPPRLLLGDGTLQVSEDISPEWPVLSALRAGAGLGTAVETDVDGHRPYTLSSRANELILMGCNLRATLKSGNLTMSSCSSFCDKGQESTFTSGYLPSRLESSMLCSGIGCCQAPVVVNCFESPALPGGIKLAHITSYDVELQPFGWDLRDADRGEWPPRVFVARNGWFEQTDVSRQLLQKRPPASMAVPVSLDWEVVLDRDLDIGHGAAQTPDDCPREAASIICKSNHSECTKGTKGGYTCFCKDGYQGNPYIADGCQDIDECDQTGDRQWCYGDCTNKMGSFDCQCPAGTHGNPTLPGGCFSSLVGNCSASCGNLSVPYPFGIGPATCYFPGFNLTCDTSNDPPRLLLGTDGTLQVVDISFQDNTVRAVRTHPTVGIYAGVLSTTDTFSSFFTSDRDDVPYSLSTGNELILVGCGVQAVLSGSGNPTILSGCSSFCSSNKSGPSFGSNNDDDDYCYGVGCCQARISMSRDGMPTELGITWIDQNNVEDKTLLPSYAVITEQGWFTKRRVSDKVRSEYSQNRWKTYDALEVPIILDWEVLQPGSRPRANVSSQYPPSCPVEVTYNICKSKHSLCKPGIRGYLCHCEDGYEGNPYLIDGCEGDQKYSKGMSAAIGVASGAGLILLVLIAFFISRKLKYHKAQMLKRKFFEQNRGQLLRQLISQRTDIAERMIISLEELEKATNNFDKSRELGGGGHGTVYKGILSDLHVVAIKKPKKVVQKEIDEFINEVAILSQINHRNVVQLYGCCLETEVPMLVYEFISNGTLHDHLHVKGPRSLSWDNRLRIAIETAKSIAHLHSSASIPIIHRDIKSVNILLDDMLTAKVADFGASRYVPIDKSGLTTMVQGTIGYMDPMYFYTGRLTEKSDVYGFGVMLVEILTRQKPFAYMSPEGDGLVAHFVSLFGEGKLSQILDPQVMEEGGKEVEEVIVLAIACIKLRGEERPTMRQVELALETIQSPKQLGNVVATKFDKDSITYSLMKDGRSSQACTRQYSTEQAFQLSASYPR